MSGSKTEQTKLPTGQKNWRLGGRQETGTTKKVKGKDRIAFEYVTKPGTDPEFIFALVVTSPWKKENKTHAIYV